MRAVEAGLTWSIGRNAGSAWRPLGNHLVLLVLANPLISFAHDTYKYISARKSGENSFGPKG